MSQLNGRSVATPSPAHHVVRCEALRQVPWRRDETSRRHELRSVHRSTTVRQGQARTSSPREAYPWREFGNWDHQLVAVAARYCAVHEA